MPDIDKLLQEAVKLSENGDTNAAIEKYQSVLKLDNKHLEAQFQIGEMYHKLGNLPAALSAYYRTVDIDPNHQKANVKIEMIKSILDFFNPDMYNP